MNRSIALAPITTPELSPPQTVLAAARAGYSHVGLRLLPSMPGGFSWPLASDPILLTETLDRMQETGIRVLDIDIIRLGPESQVDAFERMFETAAELGARAVLLVADDPELERLAENYAALCDLAGPFDLTVDLEFIPYSQVPDLATALRVLTRVDRLNAGVVIDALHVDRSGTRIADLSTIDPRWLHYLQLCDAPATRPVGTTALIHEARSERLLPGEGQLDLAGILQALPADLPISLEVPREAASRTIPPEERARQALQATLAVLAST